MMTREIMITKEKKTKSLFSFHINRERLYKEGDFLALQREKERERKERLSRSKAL